MHRHEGPQTPRKFEYAARDIAAALLRVGEGMTYKAASLEGAFSGPHVWEAFKQRLATEGVKEANAWVERWDPIVSWQLQRRPLVSRRGADYPLTTGGLEAKLEFVKAAIGWRRYGFKNRARLDRLLMLIELQQNGQADQTAYARIIRDWLLANGGRAKTRRRELADPLGRPSLRAPTGSKATRPRRPKKAPAPAQRTVVPPAQRTVVPPAQGPVDDLPF